MNINRTYVSESLVILPFGVSGNSQGPSTIMVSIPSFFMRRSNTALLMFPPSDVARSLILAEKEDRSKLAYYGIEFHKKTKV